MSAKRNRLNLLIRKHCMVNVLVSHILLEFERNINNEILHSTKNNRLYAIYNAINKYNYNTRFTYTYDFYFEIWSAIIFHCDCVIKDAGIHIGNTFNKQYRFVLILISFDGSKNSEKHKLKRILCK